eukprot:scaffold238988_cov31-Tisochrysis_lutea.AAC.3
MRARMHARCEVKHPEAGQTNAGYPQCSTSRNRRSIHGGSPSPFRATASVAVLTHPSSGLSPASTSGQMDRAATWWSAPRLLQTLQVGSGVRVLSGPPSSVGELEPLLPYQPPCGFARGRVELSPPALEEGLLDVGEGSLWRGLERKEDRSEDVAHARVLDRIIRP